jgi:peptide/nickel transport system permease protein
MTAYIIRRLLLGLLVLLLVTVIIFCFMRLLPGDPLYLFINPNSAEELTPEAREMYMHQYGLDKSLPMQYFSWISGVLHGDLGKSTTTNGESVNRLIGERIPTTLYIGILALILGSLVGIILGTVCALRRGKWIDTVLTVLANIGITIPSFFIGIILIYVLTYKLGWLRPPIGYVSPLTNFGTNIQQIIMPVIVLSIFLTASLTRQTRSSMLEVIQQDYIRTAWAKGLRERMIIIRHTLKNGLIPVVTTMGMHVGLIFGGAVIVETVFNIPGMGRLMRDAVFGYDYQVVQGGVLIISAIIILANIIVDISYGWFDPRIRYS